MTGKPCCNYWVGLSLIGWNLYLANAAHVRNRFELLPQKKRLHKTLCKRLCKQLHKRMYRKQPCNELTWLSYTLPMTIHDLDHSQIDLAVVNFWRSVCLSLLAWAHAYPHTHRKMAHTYSNLHAYCLEVCHIVIWHATITIVLGCKMVVLLLLLFFK